MHYEKIHIAQKIYIKNAYENWFYWNQHSIRIENDIINC